MVDLGFPNSVISTVKKELEDRLNTFIKNKELDKNFVENEIVRLRERVVDLNNYKAVDGVNLITSRLRNKYKNLLDIFNVSSSINTDDKRLGG